MIIMPLRYNILSRVNNLGALDTILISIDTTKNGGGISDAGARIGAA